MLDYMFGGEMCFRLKSSNINVLLRLLQSIEKTVLSLPFAETF
jgi:hypothetical protein